jgi:hypothetical protein
MFTISSLGTESLQLPKVRQRPHLPGGMPPPQDALFYALDVANIPDDEYTPEKGTRATFHKRCTSTCDPAGFPEGSLGLGAAQAKLEFWPHAERLTGFSLYVALNVMPVSLGPLALGWWLLPGML